MLVVLNLAMLRYTYTWSSVLLKNKSRSLTSVNSCIRSAQSCQLEAMSDTLMLRIADGPPGFQKKPSIWLPVALAVNLLVWAWFNMLYMALVSVLNFECEQNFLAPPERLYADVSWHPTL